MRFDVAVNGMTYGAWKTGRLPLMRDGTQWRPMLHVGDAGRALLFMLEADAGKVNGQIFNVGSAADTYRIGALAELVAGLVPRGAAIEWYGDPDTRSYRVGFDKLEALGFRAARTVADGVAEICAALEAGTLERTLETLTLDWYRELTRWHAVIREVELHGGILDI
jgi:nucleoside-diphosphate-sugar epimerase